MSISLTSYDPTLSSSLAPKLVPFPQIESILLKLLSTKEGVEEIIQSQKQALQLGSSTSISTLPIQTAGQPPQPQLLAGAGAQVCIKTGYKQGGEVMVSKFAAGGGDAGNTGAVSVYDQKTLRLKAILCDEGLLTEVRTAAACAYASREMLRENMKNVSKIGVLGGGVQAVWQLRLLYHVTSCRKVIVKTQSKESANKFIKIMKDSSYSPDHEWTIEHYNDEEKFLKCQLIHTLTPARKPVLDFEDVSVESGKFLHISCVGADSPGKCEVDPCILEKADLVYCDLITQTKERGEFQTRRNLNIDPKEIGGGVENFPESKNLLTIFDSSGLAIQDVEIADLLFKHLS